MEEASALASSVGILAKRMLGKKGISNFSFVITLLTYSDLQLLVVRSHYLLVMLHTRSILLAELATRSSKLVR